VNSSGGLKAKGHPPGATGVAQYAEILGLRRDSAVEPSGVNTLVP
jgi:acetyl-CoA C-acetyltransferase